MTSDATTSDSTRIKVATLTVQGLKPRQIAAALGLSTQAVYKHLRKLRELGELPEENAS